MRVLLYCAVGCLIPPIASAMETTALEELMETPVAADFNQVPLTDAIARLSEAIGSPIRIDAASLEDEGLTTTMVVDLSLDAKRALHQVAALLLDDSELTLVPNERHGVLTVMSRIKAQEMRTTCVYDVTDFAKAGFLKHDGRGSYFMGGGMSSRAPGGGQFSIPGGVVAMAVPGRFGGSGSNGAGGGGSNRSGDDRDSSFDAGRLIDIIVTQTSGPWEDIEGAGGTIDALVSENRALIIATNTYAAHREVRGVLSKLRSAIDAGDKPSRNSAEAKAEPESTRTEPSPIDLTAPETD